MTNAEKLNEIVKNEFGVDGNSFIYFLDSHSCYGFKCESPWCNKCSHRDFWKKEVEQNEGHKGFENGWTKASEKLPDDYMPLYVTIEKDGKRVVEDSYFNAGDKVFVKDLYSNYAEGEVLAWMPWGILEPWKGK